jgi:hypothetical protein
MGLEERCEDDDMHVSTVSIPIIREEKVGIVDENSPADTQVIQRLEKRLEDPTAPQWPPVVYAPLGEPEFWLDIHLGLVSYALRVAGESILEKQLADARIALIQNDLYRQFTDKIHLSNELFAQKVLTEQERIYHLSRAAHIISRYINLIYERGIMLDRHESEVQELGKAHELDMQLLGLCASNEIEAKDNVIKMYEARFGSREELMKLARAEEKSKLPGMLGPRKYADISTFVKQHETGKQPKTVGQQMVDCFEKLLNPDTYGNIARAVYRAFRK